jgi:hypothetical protein
MPFDMNSRPSMKMPSPPMTGTRMSFEDISRHDHALVSIGAGGDTSQYH